MRLCVHLATSASSWQMDTTYQHNARASKARQERARENNVCIDHCYQTTKMLASHQINTKLQCSSLIKEKESYIFYIYIYTYATVQKLILCPGAYLHNAPTINSTHTSNILLHANLHTVHGGERLLYMCCIKKQP